MIRSTLDNIEDVTTITWVVSGSVTDDKRLITVNILNIAQWELCQTKVIFCGAVYQ